MKRFPLSLSMLVPLSLALAAPAIAQQPAAQAAARSTPVQPAPTATPAPSRPATAPAPALTPAQQAALEKQNAEMQQAALRVAQLVDGNRAGEAWDGASTVARKAQKRDEFLKIVGADRARLGALVGRGQPSISRVKYNGDATVPEGLYVSVTFPTRFANSAQPVRELVSFRLDEDQVWRLSGYSVRPPGA
ncbi:DUF4019 domain-containing protein [Stenotrophomonas tumulicola]|uniref:DUF4019 domain-containing protein n=1 Tax=Stenotrophomonas tumulicola TaxID=1685415 RepID=A0A7W3FPN8_9GAMM|nr:DUF4019 domain-containing protein [Stenotrophomonas tumulicola]MBA8683342.1 DUF4019 domain-containing protein [Stenotrophomonas tumulicola]